MTLEACYAKMGGDCGAVLLVLGNEERARRYLLRFAEDPTARMLFAALAQARWGDALRAAHTLRGLCRGLGLARLCASCSALGDALRKEGLQGDAMRTEDFMMDAQLAHQVKEDYETVLRAIDELKNGEEEGL
ncbi:MAG: Hpt domain-containing protein [Clostridia bacterium]|nr:Hpt domain-containing protein [Clostridia bacterium]